MEFEKKLARLQDIVKKMETGELSLDDSLKFFEEGSQLSKACNEELQAAEQKVQKLLGANEKGEPLTENFETSKDEVPF